MSFPRPETRIAVYQNDRDATVFCAGTKYDAYYAEHRPYFMTRNLAEYCDDAFTDARPHARVIVIRERPVLPPSVHRLKDKVTFVQYC